MKLNENKDMENQLIRLNGLRADFMKWADSNEPNTWELELNEIGGSVSGYTHNDDPIVLLDCCDKKDGEWFLCVNGFESEGGCFPVESLTAEQVYEIRRLVESWLARKDAEFF